MNWRLIHWPTRDVSRGQSFTSEAAGRAFLAQYAPTVYLGHDFGVVPECEWPSATPAIPHPRTEDMTDGEGSQD